MEESNIEFILFIIQTGNIFVIRDNRIIGRKFDVAVFGLPSFCSALKNPCLISYGCLPVVAILLYISKSVSRTTPGEYFVIFTLM